MTTRAILCALAFAACLARGEGVGARLSSPEAEAGEGVGLILQVDGGPDERPEVPEVKDLIVNPRGTSQQMRFANGSLSRSVVYTYAVGSHKPGVYMIPPIKVSINGKEYETQPLKLTVQPSSNAKPQSMADGDDPSGSAPGDFGFITFKMVKNDRPYIYPGEIVPVRIKVYFPRGAKVYDKGPPRPEGSAFTIQNLSDQPEQSYERVGGKEYVTVTWFGGLSATKAGKFSANFVMDARVAVRDRSARRPRRGGSMFDDPFFQDALDAFDDMTAPMMQKDVSLKSANPPDIEVRELPAKDRPDDFTGAIGQFSFESINVPVTMETGEPVRVEAKIKGRGNFSLLGQPKLVPADDWKVYNGKDDFTPADVASFAGVKNFEFSAVPLSPGKRDVKLGFSYFDPETGEYRHVDSDPQAVEITGASKKEAEAVAVAESKPAAPRQTGPQLAPLSVELGAVTPYQPLTSQPWFVPVAAGSGLLTLGLLGLGLWRDRRAEPERAARREAKAAEARALKAADSAVNQGDATGFIRAAREAIRQRFVEMGGARTDAVTLEDLQGKVSGEVQEIWRLVDRLDYSGGSLSAEELRQWNQTLKEELASQSSPKS